MLPQTVKGKEATFTVVLMTTGSQLKRDTEVSMMTTIPTPIPRKGNSLDRMALKRTLKTVIRMLKCGSPQLMASVGVSGEELSFLYMNGQWELDHAPVSIWSTQAGLGVLWRGGGDHKGEQTQEDWK